MRFKAFTLGVLLLFLSQFIFSQQKASIEGYVFDAKAGYPLIDANVWLKGTDRGEVTNFKGYFAIKNLEPGVYTIVVSYVGYKKWEETIDVKVGEVKNIEVYLEELPYISVEEIVILGKPLESYNQVDVMRREIAKKVPRDLGDFLRNVSNVSAIKKGGYGLDPVVRGFKFDQINAQVDNGIKIEPACPNRMDPQVSHVQAEDLEKIEVLKGPYVLRFGPNVGGVVNLVMERPKRYERFSLGTSIESGYESNWNGRILRGVISGGMDLFDFRIGGGTKIYSDYKDGNGSVVPSRFKVNDWTAKLGINPTENERFQFSFRHVLSRDVMFPSLPMDNRKDHSNVISFDYMGRNLSEVINLVNLKIYSSKVYHWMDNEFKPTRQMVEASTEANTYVFGWRGEIGMFIGSDVIFWGLDYSKTEKDGYRTRKMKMTGKVFKDNVWQNSYVENLGIFAEYRTKFGYLNIISSARVDFNKADSRDPDKAFMDSLKLSSLLSKHSNFSASLGFIYPISSSVDMTILLGSSQRSPNISERYINFLPIGIDNYDYVGNPSVRSERNNSIDLILRARIGSGVFKGDVFYSYVKDFISSKMRLDLRPKNMGVLGVKQFSNISSAKFYGFEFSYSSEFAKKLGLELALSGTTAKDNVTGEPLPEIPPYEGKATIYYNFWGGRVVPELTIRAVARKSDVATSWGETKTPGFVLVNFLLSVNYRYVEVFLGVNNVFDKAYYEHLNRKLKATGAPYYEPGRVFFINIKIKGDVVK